MNELSVTDDVETIYAFNDGVNPGVETGEVGDLALDLSLVERSSWPEEISTESIVRVVENSVLRAGVGS